MKRLILFLILSRVIIFALPILIYPPQQISWNHWDSPHFLYIAENGYSNLGDAANFIVFPPLYPLFIKIMNIFVPNYLLSAIIISNICFVIGGVIFYKLITKIWSKKTARKAIFLLCIFPTSYFFNAPYTESLFFLLTISCFWFAYKKNWWLAGLFGGLSFLTRHPGLILLPSLSILIIKDKQKVIEKLIQFILPFSICIGIYLTINFVVFGDFFAFKFILENHWAKKFAFPWESISSSWKYAIKSSGSYALTVGFWEAIPATISLAFIPVVWKKIKKLEWKVFYTLTVLFITSTSFLLSSARYLLVVFPIFVILAIIGKRSKVLFLIWSIVSTSLLIYFLLRFTNGQWAF